MNKSIHPCRHDTDAARLSDHDLDQIHLFLVVELNKIRSSVIESERLVRLIHQDRHPMPKIEVDMSLTQPLDPEVRADIDATP